MIVTGQAVGDWVALRIGCHYDRRDSQAVGWLSGGEITAGVIYENWNKRSVTSHIAIDKPLTKGFVRTIFDYPFEQMGAAKILCPVAEGNNKSHVLCQKLGFIAEAVISDAHPTGSITIYTMRRDRCRWIRGNHGKR